MEELAAKIVKAVEYLEGIDYSKALKNGIVVLSFSILHFFGYVYFAFGSVPPFVDFKSFSSLIFVGGGFLAISSLVSRVISIFFLRFFLPYFSMFITSRRRLKHISLRAARREKNGFAVPKASQAKQRHLSRNLERTRVLYREALELPERRYDLMLRYALLTLIFSVLYLGWDVALVCILAILLYGSILFLTYSVVFILLEAAVQISIKRFSSAEGADRGSLPKEMYQVLVSSFRSLPTFTQSYIGAENKFLKLFVSANIGLIIVIAALVFGAGRSAHILSTEIFDVVYETSQQTEVHPTSVVLITSNGVLGLSESEQELLFISFDSGPVITPSKAMVQRSYVKPLIQTLFPFGQD